MPHCKRLVVLYLFLVIGSPVLAEEPTYTEPYRPAYHFTPPVNWANDPNGLVYFDGEYHLFYQHNPFGNTWGHMSWGHTVSPDLVHWKHLPVAIPERDDLMAFSGSAVVDHRNTSGFGGRKTVPLVAIYTAYRPSDGRQSQYLAFSLDQGRTWTPYSGNPVLDIESTDFRDPKVFWHAPDQRWIMVIALPTDRKVRFYASKDLKAWEHLSDFGPAGAIGGAWECPDLFELPVEGLPGQSRWVLQVDLDRRAWAGGSGGQYFIGTFNGGRFVIDEPSKPILVPDGVPIERFDDASRNGWQFSGNAFGAKPGRAKGMIGVGCLHSGIAGDKPVGTAESPEFRIENDYLNFLLGGGRDAERLAVELLVDDRVARATTGKNGDVLDWFVWDVSDLRGKTVRVRVRDESDQLWGHIVADHFVLSQQPARPSVHRGRWVDYGKDFYAVTSWSNIGDRRIWLAWMNNWEYGERIPTKPWRSAMTIPREVRLRVIGDGIQLVQHPIRELKRLRAEERRFNNREVEGVTDLDQLSGNSLEIEAVFQPLDSREFGIIVNRQRGEGTRIGYDCERSELYVDRSGSGNVDFDPGFAGRTSAPLVPDEAGHIRIHVFVDRSSVEVFGNNGAVTLTNRVFPTPGSDGVSVFADKGKARLVSFRAWKLRSIWHDLQD